MTSMYFQMGGLFPERRFLHGMAKNISTLDYLVNFFTPEFSTDSWEIPKFKVKTRDPDFWKTHIYGPKLTAKKEDWELDKVIDFYTESSRVSTPGYGEQYSLNELWIGVSNNDSISKLKAKNPEDLREIFNKNFTETRLAYVTVSKGLYTRLKTLNASVKNVLDISAFGDILVAAAGCQLSYTGIDPDDSLSVGISKLRQDLEKITNYPNKVYTLPLEGFWPKERYSIITLSPPPFNAEPYNGGVHQTHKTYPDFKSWFNGFLRESIYRCSKWILPDGILAFSVLDRIPKSGENKITIVYTEALLFLAEEYGFEFVEIFGLPNGTPWWVFKYTGNKTDKLKIFYPELSETISNSVLLEYVRKCCLKYVSEQLKTYSSDDSKIDNLLGRFLMSKLDDKGDPLFIDSSSSYAFINFDDFKIDPPEFIFQNSNGSYYTSVVFNNKKQYITSIFDEVSRYIRWLQNTSMYHNASKMIKLVLDKQSYINVCIEKRNALTVIGMLRKLVPFGEAFNIKDLGGPMLSIWKSSMPYHGKDILSKTMSDIRYDSLNLYAHHFTRPLERIKIMEEVAKEKVIDLFATPFNANSELFMSPYPDVDKDSLGNFFTADFTTLCTSTFMANPPDYPGFIDKVIEKIDNVLKSQESTFYVGTVLWEDTDMKYINSIKNLDNVDFRDIDNPIISYVFNKMNPEYLKVMYILDKTKFPSLNPVNNKSFSRSGSESVGLVLSSKVNWQYDEKLELLGPNAVFE